MIFFVISLLTNIVGPLVPAIIQTFQLNLTMAAFLPFSFFCAYAVMSIPAGIVIERWGEKPVLVGAFALALAGSLLFAFFPYYHSAICSLFLIGLGMAALQVAINPLLRVTGGEEHFAFNGMIVQLVFGSASFLSPLLYRFFVSDLAGRSSGFWSRFIPPDRTWIVMYWFFSAVALAMVLLLVLLRIPRVERNEDEKVGAWETHRELLARPTVWLFFVAVFAYVGLEQGLSNWMSQFLFSQHGFDPQTDGATAVSRFWGVAILGCAIGLFLLKFFDSRRVLLGFSALAFFTLGAALFGNAQVSLLAFPATGFAISVMWSIIFSLALNSLAHHHGTFSGILCTGIVGGAVVPLLIGSIGDHFSLRTGLCFLYLPLAYIFSIGIWAKPLVTNKTFGS